jgi:hypothetical protein
MGFPPSGADTGHDTSKRPPRPRPPGGRRCVILGLLSFHLLVKRAEYHAAIVLERLHRRAKGDIVIETAEEARPRSEIVWVALYSVLVFLLMLA